MDFDFHVFPAITMTEYVHKNDNSHQNYPVINGLKAHHKNVIGSNALWIHSIISNNEIIK